MTRVAWPPAAGPAAIATPARLPVAGLDLLTGRERDADGLAQAVGAALASRGAVDVTTATHWARSGDSRHIALTVEVAGISAESAWQVLHAVLRPRPGDSAALLFGDRYAGARLLRPAVEAAVDAHTARSGGRVVVFPGSATLTGTLTIREVLQRCAIDRVQILAGGNAAPDALLVTRDFIRPRWTGGALVLDTQPAVGGTLVPFETPLPTPCCADHA